MNNLSNDQKSLNKLIELKALATGKQFAENHDTRFTNPDAVAAAADDYLDDLIKNHQDQPAPLPTTQEFADEEQDEAGMVPVREAWARDAESYQNKLNKSINTEKDARLKYALNRPDGSDSINRLFAERKRFDNESIQSRTTKKGGKSRVFRKKSNKTKKVSRRNRRSRNIRRNSRVHKRK